MTDTSCPLCSTNFHECGELGHKQTPRTSREKETLRRFTIQLPIYCDIINIEQETDSKLNQHRHLMIETCHMPYLRW